MESTDHEGPRGAYQQRIAKRDVELAAYSRRHVLLGYVRLAIVVVGGLVLWYGFHREVISRWWLAAVCAAFVVVARKHSEVLQQRTEAQRAKAFLEGGVARIEDRWMELPYREPGIDLSTSLFAEDLDLFGRAGVFHLLDRTRTSLGADTLAGWLLEPAPREEILRRQAAVAELRAKPEFREEFASVGGEDFERLDLAALTSWVDTHGEPVPAWLRWVAPVLVALTLASGVWFLVNDHGWPLLGMVLLDAAITFGLQKRTQRLFLETERASGAVRLASVLIGRWEKESFQSELLQELRARIASEGEGASLALARLARLAAMMEQRANYIVRILDAPLLYSVQLAAAAQVWRRHHGASLERWLRALGEIEALSSLAAYGYEHPADPFPELAEGAPCFEAKELGHPLLSAAQCVRNDVALGERARLLVVSGSNMSGKSTLLRAVGVNAVLAMAGGPVRAAALRIAPLHLGASIRVNDSLQQGRSRFYAEILRLRAICALAEEQPPALFLLDELLDGTNSSDRLTGAMGIARALLESGAIGLISTHDLALTEIGVDGLPLRNVHFEERIESGEMHFDFRLRDGVVTTRNGLALMRLVGLDV